MPELTLDELNALLTWMIDAMAFLPFSEEAKPAVDKLIAYQQKLKEQEENKKNASTLEAWAEGMWGRAMWSDKNIAEFGELL